MTDLDRFAIVIPAYNAQRYLAETLRSAVSAGPGLAEVIVVDDGSTDATAEVVAEFQAESPRVTLIRQDNGGVARARNAGLARVCADYVCFLDADDVLLPGGLDALRRSLRDRADAAAAFGRVSYIDSQSRPHPTPATPVRRRPSVDLADVLAMSIIDTPGAILFRTEAVRAAGGFSPGLAMAEDWEMYVRVAMRGAFVASDAIVLDYRVHAVSAMRGGSLDAEAFEPALRAVYGHADRYAGRVEPAALRRCEWHSRARILRIVGHNATGAAKGMSLIAAFGRLTIQARFDRLVVALAARAAIRLGREVVRGEGRARLATLLRSAEMDSGRSGAAR